VGTSDLNGAALGAGVTSVGEICLASGSFENLLIATSDLPSETMLMRGLSITPHPGSARRAIWAICPTGTAVLNWARNLMGVSIEALDAQLEVSPPAPGPELAIPFLSGAFMYWEGGRKLRGGLLNLTLASQPIDLIRSFMESIAYDHVHTLSLLQAEGVAIDSVRAMGGGTRSSWWTQLKADMIGIPIEVVRQPEPGTLGGALLAGLALGEIEDLASASQSFSGISRRHDPDPDRSALHREKRARYHDAVQQMLTLE
jgi:sugar (pentulose or hexulose) kinase